MMQESLAESLRILRARRGLTLTDAAERAGVTRDTLSDLERGKRHAYMPTLAKIAKGYGIPVEDLLEEPILAGPKAEAPDTGLSEVTRPDPDYPYPWMGDTLARTTDRWAEAVRGLGEARPDPKYSHSIALCCLDVLWSVLRYDVPGDTLRDRVPEEEEANQRARLAQKLFKLVESAQDHYADSKTAEPAEVRSLEEYKEDMRRRSREISA